ncbi:MAG: SPFH domain-containing protein [Candidatus Jordarchaeaceae archaeon]
MVPPNLQFETPFLQSPLFIAIMIVIILALLILFSGLRVYREYERAVIFRLGRALPGAKGPGLIYIIPIIDRAIKVDLRENFFDVPRQKCITKDNAPVEIDVLIYHRIMDAYDSVVKVQDWRGAAMGLSQTTLRSVVGDINLDDILAQREHINNVLREKLDEVTNRWGVKVTSVEIREILPPSQVLEAMIKQMEAERIRRATVTEADGTRVSSIKIAEGQKNSTIIRAEAMKKALILRAEAKRQASILKAEGYSKALDIIQNIAKDIDSKTLGIQYLDTLKNMASGSSKKYVIPNELLNITGQFGKVFGGDIITNPGKKTRKKQDASTIEI